MRFIPHCSNSKLTLYFISHFNQDGSLHQINLNSNAEGEDPDSILEDDNDDIKESADEILAP
ncbi:4318_t:CDS:2 [Entrophospora sp. SA101]|nr:4318_t:CDS:2 [Entrophospora sp. SA101]